MADYNWSFGTSGQWHVSNGWQPFGYPLVFTDNATINVAGQGGAEYTVEVTNFQVSNNQGGFTRIEVFDVGNLTLGADANLLIWPSLFRIGYGLTTLGDLTLRTKMTVGTGAAQNNVTFTGGGAAGGSLTLESLNSIPAALAGTVDENGDVPPTTLNVDAMLIRTGAGTQSTQKAGTISDLKLVLASDTTLRAETWSTLIVDASKGVTNLGVIEAVGTGAIDIKNGVIDQWKEPSSLGEIRTVDTFSTIDLENVTIKGGQLSGGGAFGITMKGTSILDGTTKVVVNNGLLAASTLSTTGFFTNTASGALTVQADLISKGTINNAGSIRIVTGNLLVDGAMSDTLTLSGTGILSLQGSDTTASTIGVTGSSFPTTLTNNSRIFADEGLNAISGANLTLVNGSTGTIAVNPGFFGPVTLTIDTGAGLTNHGKLETSETLVVADAVTGVGSLTVRGAGIAKFTSSFSQPTTFQNAALASGDGNAQRLEVGQAYSGAITGFGTDDKVDLNFLTYSGSLTATWQGAGNNASGVLSIKDGASTVATLNLIGGYGSSRFSLSADSADGSTVVMGVGPANSGPTDIFINNATATEKGGRGTLVGTFSATDPTPNETFTYTLLDDAGGRFALSPVRDLRINSPLDPREATSHDVTVRVTDSTGYSRTEVFTITVQPDGDTFVESPFYFRTYRDVFNAGAFAVEHYYAFGWKEGRDPSAFFSTSGYLAANPDVRAAGLFPLGHYDQYGWKEGRDPSASFDNELYLERNADVRAAGIDPLAHFLQYGQSEGRAAYQAVGRAQDFTSGSFDAQFYLLSNPDVARAAITDGTSNTFAFAEQHFRTYGWHEGRNPNAVFDVRGYLDAYGDVAAAGIDPVAHYDQYGWREGRDPSASFDSSEYLTHYSDVAQAGADPLTHYLGYGIHEGRSAYGDGMFG